MKKYIRTTLQLNETPIPWMHMILCVLATCIPLAVGAYQGHLVLSVYGAITGYLVALNDHFGSLLHRLWVITLTFILLVAGASLGFEISSWPMGFYIILLSGLIYWLGVLAGQGAELERGVLFSATALIIAHSSARMSAEILPLILFYIGVGYVCLVLSIPILAFVNRQTPQPHRGLRESFRKSLTWKKENHIHALSYTLIAIFSVFLTQFLHLERGYWATITFLLVMKPDRTQSVYISIQRFLGTLAGIPVAEAILTTISSDIFYFLGIASCAACVPWALKKNYALAAFFITVMVIFLLELSFNQQKDTHLPLVRLQATLIGCALSLMGTFISKALSLIKLKT